MAQVVKSLPNNCESLSSNYSPIKKKKNLAGDTQPVSPVLRRWRQPGLPSVQGQPGIHSESTSKINESNQALVALCL
jgi:hypothetical protein